MLSLIRYKTKKTRKHEKIAPFFCRTHKIDFSFAPSFFDDHNIILPSYCTLYHVGSEHHRPSDLSTITSEKNNHDLEHVFGIILTAGAGMTHWSDALQFGVASKTAQKIWKDHRDELVQKALVVLRKCALTGPGSMGWRGCSELFVIVSAFKTALLESTTTPQSGVDSTHTGTMTTTPYRATRSSRSYPSVSPKWWKTTSPITTKISPWKYQHTSNATLR
jgi:hypothetical protein